MSKHSPNFDYESKMFGGKLTLTATVLMYAPDGSIFKMASGGDPLNYVRKGYLLKRTPEWELKHDAWEAARLASLEISNFDREIRNDELELEAAKEAARMKVIREEKKAAIAKAKAELENPTPEPEPEPEPEAEPEAPKPKARRK